MSAVAKSGKKKKKRGGPSWLQGPVYALVRTASAASQLAGVEASMRAMRDFGGAFATMPFNRKRLQRAIDNIQWCFPDWDEQTRHEHAVEAYRHLFMLAVEIGAAPRLLTEDGYAAYIEIGEMHGGLLALLSGRPAVLVTGHCGNWELLGYTMALLGFPMHALYRPLDSKPLDEWVKQTRTRRGLNLVDKFGAARALPTIVARGDPVGFIADQNAGDRGMFVPFFDRLASAYKAIGLMAMQHDAVVICGQARRLSGMTAERAAGHADGSSDAMVRRSQLLRYRIEVVDMFTSEDWSKHPDPLFYITARYRRSIEAMVRRAPEQYLWMHRYWKSRPAFEKSGKPIPDKMVEKIAQLPWITTEALERIVERGRQDARETLAEERGKGAGSSVIAPGSVVADTPGPGSAGAVAEADGVVRSVAADEPAVVEDLEDIFSLAKSRQILLVRTLGRPTSDEDDEVRVPMPEEMTPLGRMSEVIDALRDFNTAPDGARDTAGVVFGPGFSGQLPLVGMNDDVGQVLVSISEDEIAWPVLFNICRQLGWKLMDPTSGRMFG